MDQLHRQVQRVSRRLWLQQLLRALCTWWTVGLLGTMAWLLLEPFLLGPTEDGWRWTLAGSAFGMATLVGAVASVLRAPSRVQAALALDERCGLKERVTTSLLLTPAEQASPAGQALLSDVEQRLQKLDVGGRFPLRLAWSAALAPVCAISLALVACFYHPDITPAATVQPRADTITAAEAKEIENKILELQKKRLEQPEEVFAKSEKLKEFDKELQELLAKDTDLKNKESIREKVAALQNLQEKMKERINELKDLPEKRANLQKQLEKLKEMKGDEKLDLAKDGPAKEMLDALEKGDTRKAEEALEKLSRKLAQKDLSKEEQQQLAKQLDTLERQLKRLADKDARQEQLKKDRAENKLSQEELEQALKQLAQDNDTLEQLEDLAEKLGECKKCLGEGKDGAGKAARRLKELAEKLKEINIDEKELKKLLEDQEQLETLGGLLRERLGLRGLGDNQPIPASGQRPLAQDGPTSAQEARQKATLDPSGKLQIKSIFSGGTFSRVPAKDVPATFQRTAQEAQEAIERQRIAPESAEMLKGYYKNLTGSKR